MSRPTARVLALLAILQSGGTRTVADLARRLEVDERTVRRYVSHLLDLDVPVESVRGRYGGYRLAPTHRMPPLMLTEEEGLAVLVGLVAGGRAGPATSAVAAASAAAKVRRAIPSSLGGRLDALLETVALTERPRAAPAPDTAVLLLVAVAVRDRRPVALSYTSSDGRRTDRTVQPYGVVAHSGRWYVTGADSSSGQVRSFRLDRITGPQLQPGSFDVPTGFDPVERLLAGFADAPHRHEVSLRVQGEVEQVRAQFPRGTATVLGDPDAAGWVAVRIRAERLDWVPGVLAAVALPLRVDGPPELRDLVGALAERLAAAAAPPADAPVRRR